ncbi:DUF4224 domain-containing protein [Ramlibacter sp. 2FC]|uniref:DUF4224 domain-containing protein n=1 Tax=Ramlibacter sp. 2FC TaxID=2502188 RepID=UPI0010F88115|nr:DUF4224 domain-containing protein [Ramlibacter sp. 2FC]
MSTDARLEPLFLLADEVEFLTGFKTPMRQVQWLHAKGWRFELNGNRKPIIARKYAEKMLGCGGNEEQRPRPNFAALRAV